MMEEKDNNSKAKDDKEEPRAISRREFAIGSIALISSYSSAEEHTNAGRSPIKLEKSASVLDLLDNRHILDEDLIAVIQHAEKTGEKLYEPGTSIFLSRLRLQNVYFYVEYSLIKGGYQIHSAYSHRFSF
jgi:hypothetical protein